MDKMEAKFLAALILVSLFTTDVCTPVAVRNNNDYKYLPEPGDDLPIPPIEEDPPNEFDPKEADLDPERLREKLGVDYNPNLMSVKEPEPFMHPDRGVSSPTFPGLSRSRMPAKFRKLDFDQPMGRTAVSLNRRQRRKLAQWLWQTTSCPVLYRWKNLGHRFWPPWIREGICEKNRSCSIPEGMGCRPSGSTTITILRWHCQGFSTNNKMQYCTWIKVQYPIISECKCKC